MVEINILPTQEVEININIEINISSLSRGEKKINAFNPSCEVNKNGQAKTPAPPPPRYLMMAP